MDTNINFHEEYNLLDIKAKERLKEELENVGGEYEFPEGNEPIVAAHPYDYSADYVILKMLINKHNEVCLVGREVECDELVNLSCEDIEGSHIHYIWEYMEYDND